MQVGNNETITSNGYGDIKVVSAVVRTTYRITMQRVLFTPDMIKILVSLSQVRINGFHLLKDE